MDAKLLPGGRLGGLVLEIELNGVEDAVDELSSFEGRKATGYLKSFVDDNGMWGVFKKELVNGKAKNVAVDNGHSFDTPMLSTGADAVVDRVPLAQSAVYDVVGKGVRFLVDVRLTELVPVIGSRKILRIGHDVCCK